jgi:TPR repeat protein
MRLFWKIGTPIFCVVVIGVTTIFWSAYQTKAANDAKENEVKLCEEARDCRMRAERGDARAQSRLAFMYSHGRGVPQDYAEALRWRRKAADQGDASGQSGLGYMYSHGQGVAQDYAEALRWYHMAAEQGYADAQVSIGIMYKDGLGVPQDYAEAIRWYRKGVDQGNASAQYDLGNMYYYGYGVGQDRAEANRWYHIAADQGDEYALRVLSLSFDGYRKFSLIVQLILGAIVATNFLSFNIFETGNSLRDFRQRVIAGTGMLCIFTAGLSWYGYTHYKIRCLTCGLNTFTVFKWILNGSVIALLFYIILSGKRPGEKESGIADAEADDGSDGDTEQSEVESHFELSWESCSLE